MAAFLNNNTIYNIILNRSLKFNKEKYLNKLEFFQMFETYTKFLCQGRNNAFLDEETRYKSRKFGKFQLVYFSLLNLKDIFNIYVCIAFLLLIQIANLRIGKFMFCNSSLSTTDDCKRCSYWCPVRRGLRSGGKTTRIRRAAIREPSVSRHRGCLIKDPPETPLTITTQSYWGVWWGL